MSAVSLMGPALGHSGSHLPGSPLLELVSQEYELNSNSGKISMQFKGEYCPLLLTASGLIQSFHVYK